MRPERLTMSAFGPYPQQEFLDFSQLKGEELFLICGPTGAGKSTILDAMCYALYGRTSGAVRSGESMRSNYVGPDRETYVQFDFAVGNKHYRVHRNPTQFLERKKGDSDKPVEKKAKAELYEITSEGEEIQLITVRAVSVAVENLLGVGLEQFRQIILLPQGDFRKLLLADSSDRQVIMQQLFQTKIYLLFEERLKKEALKLKSDYEEGKRNQGIYLETCEVDSYQALEEQLKAQEARIKEINTALGNEEKKQKEFQKVYDEGRRLFDAYKRKEAAENALAVLEKQKAHIEELRQKTDKVKKFQLIMDIWTETESIYKQRRALESSIEQGKQDIPKWEKEKEDVQKEAELFQQKEELYKKQSAWKTQLETYAKDATEYSEILTTAKNAERNYAKALDEKGKLDISLEKAKEKALQDKKHWMGQNELFLHSQAYVLAANLEDGAPCPVCGSEIHPKPAESSDIVITEKDVEIAAKAMKMSETAAEDAVMRRENFQREVLQKAETEKERASARIEQMEKSLPEMYRDAGFIRKEIEKIDESIAHYEKEKKRIEERQKEADLRYHGAVKNQELLEKQYETVRLSSEEKMEELRKKVKAVGFETMNECKAYRDNISFLDAWEGELKTYDERKHAEEEIKKAEEQMIGSRSWPDMDGLTKMRDDLFTHVRAITAQKAAEEETEKKEKEVLRKLDQLKKDQEIVEKKSRLVFHLSELASGKDTGVNLERFVLGALLDAVTEKANLRLKEMSGNRYALLRKRGERDDARKTAGLDLEVYDSHTGRNRPASTLSGGETFMASLSLALGLADVVQEYAGGVHLDAMFIDEGFGSLDAESLDLAMKTLQKLKGQNRLVGLISHVGGLEERIPAKLRVKKSQTGSRAFFEMP